jgi:hypothetical protein
MIGSLPAGLFPCILPAGSSSRPWGAGRTFEEGMNGVPLPQVNK